MLAAVLAACAFAGCGGNEQPANPTPDANEVLGSISTKMKRIRRGVSSAVNVMSAHAAALSMSEISSLRM